MHFNFDFVIIAVLIFGISFSFYKGIFKSANRFIHLGLSFLIIELVNQKIHMSSQLQKFVEWITRINNTVGKVFKFTDQPYLLSVWLVYILIFVIVGLLTQVLLLIFKPSTEKLLTKQPKLYSRICGSIFGLINSYLVLVVVVGLGFNIFPYQNKGLTSLFFKNPIQLTSLEKYNHYRFTIEDNHFDLKEAENYLNNHGLIYKTNNIYEINNTLRFIETDFQENFEILVTDNNLRNIIIDNLPETNLSVLGYTKSLLSFFDDKQIYEMVLNQESTEMNPHVTRLTTHFDFLKNNESYIHLLFDFNVDLNSDNIHVLFDYLVQNEEGYQEDFAALILDIKVDQYLNKWIEQHLDRTNPDEEYLELLSAAFANHEQTLEISKSFIEFFNTTFDQEDVLTVAQKYQLLFTEYIKYEKIIKDQDPSLSISMKILNAKLYNGDKEKDLLKQPLITAYLNDVLSNSSNSVDNSLEEKVDFITILVVNNIIELKSLDEEQVDVMMNNLHKLVQQNVLSVANATIILDNFIYSQNRLSYFDYLVLTSDITQSAIEKLILEEYPYLTEQAQEYLAGKYILN